MSWSRFAAALLYASRSLGNSASLMITLVLVSADLTKFASPMPDPSVATLAAIGSNDSPAEIYSARYKQQVTSSTLQWRTVNGRDYPEDLVAVGRVGAGGEVLFLCRALYLGRKIPGYLKRPLCTIELAGHVMNSTNFQVLVNIGNAAKLEWEPWMKTVWLDGAVSSDGFFVAKTLKSAAPPGVFPENNGAPLPGREEELMGKVEENHAQVTVAYGHSIYRTSLAETLVEILPTHYFINDVEFDDKMTYVKSETKVLERRIFNNNNSTPLHISEKIHYEYTAKEWWGTVEGTYAGTPTVINWVDPDTPGRGDTRIRTKLAWGAQISRKKQDFRIVDFQLPPHSRLQITLDGSVQARRRPYSARLSSFYPSNSQKTRKIRGHFLDEDLLTVEVRKEKFQLLHVDPDVTRDQAILDAERLQSSIEIDVRESTTTSSSSSLSSSSQQHHAKSNAPQPKVLEHEDDLARVQWNEDNVVVDDDFWDNVVNTGCARGSAGTAAPCVWLTLFGALFITFLRLGALDGCLTPPLSISRLRCSKTMLGR